MDINKLVDAITKEVMKRINEAQLKIQENCTKVLVLDSSNSDSFKKICDKLKVCNLSVDSLDNMNEDLDVYESIIVNSINNREFANLSIGVECGQKEHAVIQGILRGKKIYLLEEGIEYRKYASTANKMFYRLYEEYEKKLISFGITLVNENNYIEVIKGNEVNVSSGNSCCNSLLDEREEIKNELKKEIKDEIKTEIEKSNELEHNDVIDFTNKKLISEPELRKVYRQGIRKIKISKRTIISPLAKDFIRTNKIILLVIS